MEEKKPSEFDKKVHKYSQESSHYFFSKRQGERVRERERERNPHQKRNSIQCTPTMINFYQLLLYIDG